MHIRLPETDASLDPIHQALAGGIPAYLDVTARCRLVQKISASVFNRMARCGLFDAAASQCITPFVSQHFAAEDQTLAKLVATFGYSDRYQDFVLDQARRQGRAMAEKHTVKQFQKQWTILDETARLALLTRSAADQMRLFNHDNLRFAACPIKISSLRPGIAGSFNIKAWGLSERAADKTIEINLSNIQSAPAHRVMQTNWHENFHSIGQQFAAASASGRLSPSNPFYTDADILRLRIENWAMPNFLLPKAYACDPEENLAFAGQAAFAQAWADHSTVKHRLSRFFSRSPQLAAQPYA